MVLYQLEAEPENMKREDCLIKLPGITFTQALRVRTHVTAAPAAGASVSKWQVSFLYECFGEIARATSENGETQADFTTAAEVRRYGLE